MDKGIKINTESVLKIKVIDGVEDRVVIDRSTGEEVLKQVHLIHWENAEDEVSLGSLKKPNLKVLEVKYDIPDTESGISGFKKFFK